MKALSIVGPRGEKLYTGGPSYYQTPSNTSTSDKYRPRPTYGITNQNGGLNDWDWSSIVGYSRGLFAQVGTIGAAINQKNTYAVGDAWRAQYFGDDAAFGEAAEAWLAEQFYPMADVRGPSFDLSTNLFLAGVALDVDGDVLMVLTETERGFPQVKFFGADRVGSRSIYGNKIKGGQYDGAETRRGVIYNDQGRAIAYNILGEKPEDDVQVSAFNAMMLFEPEWQWQGRGIPRIARVLLDGFNLQDIDTFLMRGVKLDSSYGVLHYTESGQAPTSSDIISARDSEDTAPADIQFEEREGGEIMYMRAGIGERIEPFKSDRPHPNTEAFIARIESRVMLALGWNYGLIDPSKIGGASVRLIQDQARASIKQRQKAIRKLAKRAVNYAVAKAIKQGILPKAKDWWKFEFETPAQLTVDAGYDRRADVEDLRLGLTTKAAISAKQGKWWEDVDAQRKRELDAMLRNANELSNTHGIPLPLAIDLLEQRSSSPVTYLPFTANKPEDALE